jgi:HAD-superfamily hydrolase, subfamily IIB
MKQKDSKIVFFDVDGTLFNEKGIITKRLQETLLAVQKQGHKICIASGRSKHHIGPELVDAIPWNGYVLGNGVYSEYEGTLVDHQIMEASLVKEFVHYTESLPELALIIESNEGSYLTKRSSKIAYKAMQKITHRDYITYEVFLKLFHIVDDLSQIKNINKMMYFNGGQYAKQMMEKYADRLEILPNSVTQRLSLDEGEIMIRGITKATGIEQIIQFAGYKREDVIAFGDGYNDLEMIAYAGTGIAMGNAIDELKKVADLVTDTNRNDGVVKMLQQLKLV